MHPGHLWACARPSKVEAWAAFSGARREESAREGQPRNLHPPALGALQGTFHGWQARPPGVQA